MWRWSCGLVALSWRQLLVEKYFTATSYHTLSTKLFTTRFSSRLVETDGQLVAVDGGDIAVAEFEVGGLTSLRCLPVRAYAPCRHGLRKDERLPGLLCLCSAWDDGMDNRAGFLAPCPAKCLFEALAEIVGQAALLLPAFHLCRLAMNRVAYWATPPGA
jgi:hypothetical protein